MNGIIMFLLAMLDGVLDVVTLGRWSAWQGEKVPSIRVRASTAASTPPLSEDVQ